MQAGNSNSAFPNTTAIYTITYTKKILHYGHVPRRTLISYSMIGPAILQEVAGGIPVNFSLHSVELKYRMVALCLV